ncbi:MAG: PAQR family membrane homeostasis protein TrhA [Candidatus Dormibacteria bacterium]
MSDRNVDLAGKPLLRGWSHAVAAAAALAGTVVLLALARDDRPKQASLLVYGFCMVLLLAVSATYHIGNWSPSVRARLRRFDHANIFLMIAGTYTAVCFNLLSGYWRIGVLTGIWIIALAGIASVSPALRIPRQALALLYLLMGWVAVAAIGQLVTPLGLIGILLIVLGGVLYSTGAAFYAFKWPRLWPRVFSYHEVFHVLVVGASAVFYLTILIYVVPFHRR